MRKWAGLLVDNLLVGNRREAEEESSVISVPSLALWPDYWGCNSMATTKRRPPIEITYADARRLHTMMAQIAATLDREFIRIDIQERSLQRQRQRVEEFRDQTQRIMDHLDQRYPPRASRPQARGESPQTS